LIEFKHGIYNAREVIWCVLEEIFMLGMDDKICLMAYVARHVIKITFFIGHCQHLVWNQSTLTMILLAVNWAMMY